MKRDTSTNPDRIAQQKKILRSIAILWESFPDLRFFQLMALVEKKLEKTNRSPRFYTEDKKLEKTIENLIDKDTPNIS
jgi:hypothetical protein